MIELLVVGAFLSVFWFAIWSMIMVSPIFTVSVLSIVAGGVYLLDRHLKRQG